MKKVKFADGSFTILAIKSDLFDQEADGVFDPDGNLLKARIRFPSGMARPVPRHGKVWKEIQAIGEIRTSKRKARTPRPKAVRKQPARKTYPPFEKPRGGRRISRREQFSHDFREEQKAIAARIRGEVYVPKPYPERSKPESGTYRSFGAWVAAVRRAGGTPNSELSEPQGAFNRSTGQMVGEWDGREGMIIRRNPVKPRKGEPSRDFVSRCMSEEKESFPKMKQRIAVCLSKARAKRNPFNDRNLDA